MTGAAVVTGANRGIGLAIVRELRLRDIGPVVAGYRTCGRSGELLALARRDPKVTAIHLDVSEEASVARLGTACAELTDRVDLVINNAGIARSEGTIMTAPIAELERHVQTHAIGALRVARGVHPLLGPGSLVANVSSVLASMGSIGSSYTYYSVAKAFQNAVTLQMSACLRHRGIIVVAVHPGWVATEIGGFGAPISPAISAKGLIDVAVGATIEDTGTFLDYQGRRLPW